MCTNFKCKQAKDGTVVVGRTEEFPLEMPWNLGVLPVGYQGEGVAPKGSKAKGKQWTSTYGVIGMSCFGKPNWYADAMNEAGVSAHVLYMDYADFCVYQDFKGDGSDLSELDVVAFLLGTCASLKEVRAAAADINVWGHDPGMGLIPPVHIIMHDKDESIAIEFHPEGHRIVDNPLGVATNAPYLDWHYINAGNYLGMSSMDPSSIAVPGKKDIQALGQGQGLVALPGSPTSPSRFIRALAMVTASDQPADGHEAEQLTLHILNNFDITPGLVREPAGSKIVDQVTDYSSVSNLTDLRYAVRTFGDPTTYVIDVAQTDFTGEPRTAPLPTQGHFHPVTV